MMIYRPTPSSRIQIFIYVCLRVYLHPV